MIKVDTNENETNDAPPPPLWRRALPSVTLRTLLWFLPLALCLELVKAPFARELDPLKYTFWGSFVTKTDLFLALCVWANIRAARLSARTSGDRTAFTPWPAAALWSLLLTGALVFLYQICWMIAALLTRYGLAGLSQLPRFMAGWWPDPSQTGYPFFLLVVFVLLKLYLMVALFSASLLAFVLPYRDKTKTP